MNKSTGLTNYRATVNWLHGSLILCNNIAEIDNSVLDNMHKDLYVLCVDHFGTSWDYVMTICTNPKCERKEGEEI